MAVLLTFAFGLAVVAVLGFLLHRRGVTTDLESGRENLHSSRMDTTHLTWGRLPGDDRPRR